MKRYKESLITIGEVGAVLLICCGWLLLDNQVVAGVGMLLIYLFWGFNFVDKIKYRKGKMPHQYRFSTSNDTYYTVTSIVLGSTAIVGSVCFFIWTTANNYLLVGILIAGLLVLINGLIDTPKGIISVDGDHMTISGLSERINIHDIANFEHLTNEFKLTFTDQRKKRVSDVNTTKVRNHHLQQFLQKHQIPMTLSDKV